MRLRDARVLLLVGVALLGAPADAHWCHDLWASAYNIVVKPAQDSVTVPATGTTTLDVYVQNNMGYPLWNFGLAASASGYTITVSHQTPKKTDRTKASVYFLLPGEKLKYTLTIKRNGGSASLAVENLNFDVSFGSSGQDQSYGGAGKEAVISKTDASLSPGRPLSATGNDQAQHLHSSVQADFGDLAKGIDALMKEFCVGRASWKDTNSSYSVTTSMCPSAGPPTCGTAPGGSGYKYDYQHLWAAGELAYRKAATGFPTDVFRSQLICAVKGETQPAFQYFPYAVLGYLGASDTVRTFLNGKVSGGTADEKAAAQSALYLLETDASAAASLKPAVTAALTTGSKYVQLLAATALGIRDRDDTAVAKLIDASDWVEPDTSDNGYAMYAAHLLNIVAWDRRGWAIDAKDRGEVSFYGSGAAGDVTPPRAPTGVSCSSLADGGVRLSWAAVTQDVDGGTESVKGYVAYYGTTSRGNASAPGQFSYDHQNPPSGTVLAASPATFAGLSATQPTYFSVVAQDNASHTSVFSQEVSCTPKLPPVAVVSCSPDAGVSPLSVACTSAASTDPNGTNDIVSRVWQLDGIVVQDAGTTWSTSFPTPATHSVRIVLTDATGLVSAASSIVRVLNAGGGNNAPLARAGATPLTVQTGANIQFSSTGSSDPEGQALTYAWNFGDGTTSTQASPTHAFNAPGAYSVILTVSDNGTPALTGTDVVGVTVTGNFPPDVSLANASPRSGDAPLHVAFNADDVTDPEGNEMSFTWAFGDSSANASTRNATHDYNTPGVYHARLSVTDNGTPALASPGTRDFDITVHAPGVANRPPDCSDATVSPASGSAPLKVVLDATRCVDPDGDVVSVTWAAPGPDFSVQTFTDAKTTITLTSPGATSIKLTARDSAADSLSTERSFTVTVTTGAGGGCAAAGPELFGFAWLAFFAAASRRRRT